MNFNDTVEIELTEKGKDILNKHEESLFEELLNNEYIRSCIQKRTPDKNNKIRLPLWEVANIFGSHLYMGCREPFKMEFKIV